MQKLMWATLAIAILAGPALSQGKDEWAKGVKFHTKWETAIKEARESGKLLFIYNGWQKKGI